MLPTTLCVSGTNPIAGKTFSRTAKMYTSTSASTYGAVERPIMLTVMLSRSKMPLGLRAASPAPGHRALHRATVSQSVQRRAPPPSGQNLRVKDLFWLNVTSCHELDEGVETSSYGMVGTTATVGSCELMPEPVTPFTEMLAG